MTAEEEIRCTWDCTPPTFVNASRIGHDDEFFGDIRDADLHMQDIVLVTCPRQLDLRKNWKEKTWMLLDPINELS